jgi:hypothetical protein
MADLSYLSYTGQSVYKFLTIVKLRVSCILGGQARLLLKLNLLTVANASNSITWSSLGSHASHIDDADKLSIKQCREHLFISIDVPHPRYFAYNPTIQGVLFPLYSSCTSLIILAQGLGSA